MPNWLLSFLFSRDSHNLWGEPYYFHFFNHGISRIRRKRRGISVQQQDALYLLLIGVVISAAVGFIALRWLIKLIERENSISLRFGVFLGSHLADIFTLRLIFSRTPTRGRNWIRPDSLKCKWRTVVGQLATLKADQINLIAEDNLALAA